MQALKLCWLDNGLPDGISELGRLTLGFANVNLQASERIDANNAGTLKAYQF
ncbi:MULTISPECIES: hypothetical protein [Alcaligenaceae]|uniref:hypothetical protein n=1 Tax=Alcaligenaceae TaxID=506 RepID=UPI0002DED824